MATGKQHDYWGNKAAYLLTGTAIFISPVSLPFSVGLGVGAWVGYLYIGPDIDQDHTVISKRWGVLNKPVWDLYRKLAGSHMVGGRRNPITHSEFFSSLLRVAYLTALLSLPFLTVSTLLLGGSVTGSFVLNILASSGALMSAFMGFLGALEIQTDLHLALDWSWSWWKRIERMFDR